jgi:hypothetical protein
MTVEIRHLLECPEHLQFIARLIHEEWWTGKPGHSVATRAARLSQAATTRGCSRSMTTATVS